MALADLTVAVQLLVVGEMSEAGGPSSEAFRVWQDATSGRPAGATPYRATRLGMEMRRGLGGEALGVLAVRYC